MANTSRPSWSARLTSSMRLRMRCSGVMPELTSAKVATPSSMSSSIACSCTRNHFGEAYTAAVIDLDALVAIDVHTHVQASQDGRGFPEDSPEAAVAKVCGSDALLNVPE